jgi:uncharacterized glyoxalase superfamily protein PhnB
VDEPARQDRAADSTAGDAPSYAPLTVGLRVGNVKEASDFYQRIGFKQIGTIPDDPGAGTELLVSFLAYGTSMLLVSAIEGPPYPDSERERNLKAGPRGLGVKIALSVPDLEAIYALFKGEGCEITTEPMVEFWGVRLFTALDPDGYEWQITQTIEEITPEEGAEAAKRAWSLE